MLAKYRAVIVSCAVVMCLLLTGAASATASGSVITTSPVFLDLSGTPGTTISTNLHLQNNSKSALPVSVKLEQFKAYGDSGQAQLYKPLSSDPSQQWVSFSPSYFVAQPGVWETVKTTVNLPKSATLGYYYAVLFTPSVTVSGQHNAVIQGANAIFVLVNAETGKDNYQLQVNSFSTSHSMYQYLPVNFNVNVYNSGNIFTIPEGDIYISRTLNGPVIDTVQVNSGDGNILPGTSRVFSESWTDGFPSYQDKRIANKIVTNKNGQPIRQLVWSGKQLDDFRYGKYYARLALVYNNGSRDIAINKQISFWVIPWFPLICLVILLLLVALGLWTLIRRLGGVT